MNIHQTERTNIKRPVAPPINLDAGQLDVKRAALLGGYVLGALAIATAGAWVAARSAGADEFNRLGFVFGGGVALVALLVGGVVLYVGVSEWLDHRRRVRDWHEVALVAYEQLQATETIEQVSEWELSVESPAHVLVAALFVHLRLQEGAVRPYTVRQLEGPVFLAGRRVGDLSKLTAERMGQQFEKLGLIEGRGERRAGEWVPRSADEVLQLVLRRWP